MRKVSAKILDATHLELSQPLAEPIGEVIEISLPDADADSAHWREAAQRRLLDAYADEDAVYDEL